MLLKDKENFEIQGNAGKRKDQEEDL